MSNPPDPSLDILYLDNHLIAVRKPAGILTQPDDSGGVSLMDQVKDWIKMEYKKPGKVFLGLVHRLDRPVSGIVVFARTSKGASRLSEQFRKQTTKKIYRALVEGTPQSQQASLKHYLRKEKSLKATVFPRATPNAKEGRCPAPPASPICLAGRSKPEVVGEWRRSLRMTRQLPHGDALVERAVRRSLRMSPCRAHLTWREKGRAAASLLLVS